MLKKIIGAEVGTYPVFTPGSAGVGTLVFSNIPLFDPARLFAVTNVTRKALLYVPEAGSGAAGVWSSVTSTGGTLTLDMDTGSHNAADRLRSIYGDDIGQADPEQSEPVTLDKLQDGTLQAILEELCKLNTKIPLLNAAAQLRTTVEASVQVNENLAQIGAQNVNVGIGLTSTGTQRVLLAQEALLPLFNLPAQQMLADGFVITGGP